MLAKKESFTCTAEYFVFVCFLAGAFMIFFWDEVT